MNGVCTPVAAGRTCRGSAGVCDAAETCNGTSTACPADGFLAAGSTCRGSTGTCDVAEACDGTSAACPADVKAAPGTTCRASGGLCDVAEVCDGASSACPADAKSPAGTTCNPSAGLCDVAELCDGASSACPADARRPAGTTCRPSVDSCDVAEVCDGSATACPSDGFVAAGTACGSAGTCQDRGVCSGTSPTCPGPTPKPNCGDTEPPKWTNVPGTIVAYATDASGAYVTYTKPKATDAKDGVRPVTCTPPSGATFPLNVTTVTCTASDKSGNSSSVTFKVWVKVQAPTDGSFFLKPIRSNGSSIFRIGRPVPVRFKLTGASAGITNLVARLSVTKLSSNVQGTVEDVSDETVDDTDMIFKYRRAKRSTRTAGRPKTRRRARID